MKDDKYFRTSSFYTAAFLFARHMELVNVDRVTDPKRALFVFVDTPEREGFLQSFNFGREEDEGILVDARKLISAIRCLKEKLYEEKF
jgi:hypothetical protein